MKVFRALVAGVFLLFANVSQVHAGLAKSSVQEGFAFPKGQPVKIVVFRPDVSVGSLGAGGVATPNADWTATARTNLVAALQKNQQARQNEVVFLADQAGDNGKVVAEYQSLFRAVAMSVVQHKYFGAKLPTKKGKFDWTLGAGAAKLGEIGGGNYGLFLYTEDSYGTAGRKAAQLFAAALIGVYIPAGIHVSYAGLVDFSTGNLVWFNVDPAAGGDPRENLGAEKRIDQVLRTLPANDAAKVALAKP